MDSGNDLETLRGPAESFDTRLMRETLEGRLFGNTSAGTRVGRFHLLEVIGRGGMGTVLAAYDPQLDRRVAIKLVHALRMGTSATDERLLREARSLARLSHPNVVTVFETGTHEGKLFVAMEFLEGGTLAAYAEAQPVTTRADAAKILSLYRQAGAGLAAAHAAGLVHRDFKPSNVLRATDGRVAVADFGLARGIGTPSDAGTNRSGEPSEPAGPSPDRMTTASLAGTPAYMAPEQFEGRVDERSDQFAYCVSLWEALYGERPFVASTPAQLYLRIADSDPPIPPQDSPVPGHVQRALQRGLRPDPKERWPSIDALLTALGRDPFVHVRRFGLAAVAVGLSSLAVWQPWSSQPSPCEGSDDALEQVWGPNTRAALDAALDPTHNEFGAQTSQRVRERLDEYARQWRELQKERCEASLVLHTRSPEAYDRTMHCLERRRDELGALVTALSTGDTRAAERAVKATGALSPIERCGDSEALRRRPRPEDPERALAIDTVSRRLTQSRTLLDTGQHQRASDGIDALVEETELLGDPLQHSIALSLRARVHKANRRFAEARTSLEDALREAAKADDDAMAAQLFPRLVVMVGDHLEQGEQAMALQAAAEAAVLRAGDRPADRANLHHALGNTATAAVRLQDAEREHLAGLELRRRHLADDALGIADSLNRLAAVYFERRDLDKANELMTEVVASYADALGPAHPRVATVTRNLGGIYASMGRYAEAIELYEEALRILESVYGPANVGVGRTRMTLAALLSRSGQAVRAIDVAQRADRTLRTALGDDNPQLADPLNNLGAVYRESNELQRAKEAFERAVEVLDRAGRKDPALAMSLANLGLTLGELGELEPAKVSYLRSIEVYESTYGPEHPQLWRPLVMLARMAREQGRKGEALAYANRAVGVADPGALGPFDLADTRFEAAQARWLAGQRGPETVALATEAQSLWAEAGARAEAAVVQQWLASH